MDFLRDNKVAVAAVAAASAAGALYCSKGRFKPQEVAAAEKTKGAEGEAAAARPVAFFVLGGPGAGKGTQCAKLVEHFGFKHLSAGDLLRAERNSGSENATLINNYINEGKIVPVEITVALIKAAMEQSEVKKFLIDGFPRNTDNVAGWESVVGDFVDVKAVLFFHVSEETLEQRLLGRDEGRQDDNIETIKKRFNTYQNETMPVIEAFKKRGMVGEIDGAPAIEEVWDKVK